MAERFVIHVICNFRDSGALREAVLKTVFRRLMGAGVSGPLLTVLAVKPVGEGFSSVKEAALTHREYARKYLSMIL